MGMYRGSPPPIRYPVPSRTEAMRRNPSIAISICGFVLIMAALLGATHIRFGNWPLGVVEILIGVLIAGLVLRRFRNTLSP